MSLLSRKDAVAFAITVVLASVSSEGPTVPFSWRSTAERLALYQSLILQFSTCATAPESHALLTRSRPPTDLRVQSRVPESVAKCAKVLRTIHIDVGEYLEVIKRGGDVAKEVPRVSVWFLMSYVAATARTDARKAVQERCRAPRRALRESEQEVSLRTSLRSVSRLGICEFTSPDPPYRRVPRQLIKSQLLSVFMITVTPQLH